jgi:hypothetical protein
MAGTGKSGYVIRFSRRIRGAPIRLDGTAIASLLWWWIMFYRGDKVERMTGQTCRVFAARVIIVNDITMGQWVGGAKTLRREV